VTDLDQIDSVLLEALQRDGRASFETLGSQVGLTRIAARNRVQRLLNDGIMQIVTVVHPLARGLQTFGHLSVQVSAPAVPIAESMARHRALPFVSVVTGQFGVIAEARTESLAMLRCVVEEVQNIAGVEHVATSLYTERLLDRHSCEHPVALSEPPQMDAADVRLLTALKNEGRATFVDLARSAGLSSGAARTRVHRMRDSGIVHVGAIVRPGVTSDLGHACGIGVRTHAPETLAQQLTAIPQVHYLTHCFGSWNLIGTLRCRTIAETADIMDLVRSYDGGVESWTHLRLIKENYEGGFPLENSRYEEEQTPSKAGEFV